jgi:cytochrome c oxidase assembly protein subunit 15
MIFLMALIGAITRLTESGLSITEWQPVKGALPPLSASDWQKAFDLYKATPQYRAINQGMSLEEFKNIFFWEWLHRLWGRLIGLVYAAGLVWFWVRKEIPQGFKLPLFAALVLGGLQGLIGWLMVKSGLQPGMASVSPYRLAAHLAMALVLYGFIYLQILRLWPLPHLLRAPTGLRVHAGIGLAMLSLAIVWGALVAGLDAGKIYNTFPDMNGRFFPSDFAALPNYWQNLFENPAAVQWMHRCITISTAVVLLALALGIQKTFEGNKNAQWVALAVGTFSLLQPALGVATLLTGVNIYLGVAHQAGAIMLLTAVLTSLHVLGKPKTA